MALPDIQELRSRVGAWIERLPLPGRGEGDVPLGIDIGTRSVKLVRVTRGEFGPEVAFALEATIPQTVVSEGRILDPEGLSEVVTGLLQRAEVDDPRVVPLIGGEEVFIRKVTTNRMGKEEAVRAIPNNPKIRLPFRDLREAQIDVEILDPEASSPKMDALVVAARKDAVRQVQEVVVESGSDVAAVDVESFALYNAARFCIPDALGGRATLIDIGYRYSTIVVVQGDTPVVARVISVGLKELIERLSSGTGVLSSSEAEQAVFRSGGLDSYGEQLGEWVRQISEQARRSAQYVARDENPTGPVYLTGSGAQVPDVFGRVSESLGVSASIFDPFDVISTGIHFSLSRPDSGPVFTKALGAALRGV